MNQRVVSCPYCQQQFQTAQNAIAQVVVCPTCGGHVSVQPQVSQESRFKPRPVAGYQATAPQPLQNIPGGYPQTYGGYSASQPQSPRTGMSGGMLAGIIGGIAAFLVLVFVALGVIVYFASVPADRSTPRTDVVTSQSPSERMVSPPQGITPPLSSNALPQLSDINGGSSALKLEFQSGEKYDYFYSLKTRVNERQIEIGGMNALRIISGLRHNTAAGGDAQQIEYSAILTDRQLIGTQINSSRGKMELAQNGAAFDVYENEQTSLPILLVDIGMIGIERLETTRPSWSHEEKISVARVEEQVTSNSRDFMYRYRPYQSPQTRAKVTTFALRSISTYEIQSEDAAQVRVRKTLKIEPEDENAQYYSSANASGFFVFDKKRKVISEINMKGTAEIGLGQVSVKAPFEFNAELRIEADIVELNQGLAKSVASTSNSAGPKSSGQPAKGTGSLGITNDLMEVNQLIVGRIDKVSWGVKDLAFAPKPNQPFLVVAGNSYLSVYDWKTAKMMNKTEKIGSGSSGSRVAITPDGKQVLYSEYSGAIHIFDLNNEGRLSEKGRFDGHSSELRFILVTPDRKVLSGSSDKRVRYWNLDTKKEIFAFAEFDSAPESASLMENGKQALVFDGKFVYLLDLISESVKSKWEVEYSNASSFSPDGSLLVYGSGTQILKILDTTRQQEIAQLKISGFFPKGMGFSNDNRKLFWGTSEFAFIYDLTTKKTIKVKVHQTFGLQQVAFAPDGKHCAIATGASSGQILIMKIPD